MSNYFFPEAYVENGVESGKKICFKGGNVYVALARDAVPGECVKVFVNTPFEKLLEYMDLEKPCFLRDVIVVYKEEEGGYKGILVENGEKLYLLEASGSTIAISKREGEVVEPHEKIGYIITNKREVRVIKAPLKGILLAVIDLTWEKPEKVIMVFTGERPREVFIGKSA
ncbi:DUF2118 domain-containing protein [Thermosphaera chiliense]|uniref:DUF2118 domain-containing protein n=1 Tax=Thermosphaera chiliense TaxID=3402707 RepID=A0A7M1UQE5_9CREN|nr:DUF2118 domain-containing protein [Thermosphaera aggregans]QOR94465.1 DUF2118 domain-containing protein [Thermosphaera aggregans]